WSCPERRDRSPASLAAAGDRRSRQSMVHQCDICRRHAMTEEKKLPVLPDDEIERRLKGDLPGWWYEGRWIRRKYNTDGWLTTLALVNTIGYVAEAAAHHPDLEVTWGKVWVKLRTHSSNGVTERDVALAKRIE